MLAAELIEVPERRADRIDRILGLPPARLSFRTLGVEEQVEAFLGQREEDVVLAREIAVDRGRAVLDTVGDLPDRDVLVSLGDKQVPSRIENRA